MGADLLRIAGAWLDQDPDPRTAAELADLLERARRGDDAAQRELADAAPSPSGPPGCAAGSAPAATA